MDLNNRYFRMKKYISSEEENEWLLFFTLVSSIIKWDPENNFSIPDFDFNFTYRNLQTIEGSMT